jgi:hypothetical protein
MVGVVAMRCAEATEQEQKGPAEATSIAEKEADQAFVLGFS